MIFVLVDRRDLMLTYCLLLNKQVVTLETSLPDFCYFTKSHNNFFTDLMASTRGGEGGGMECKGRVEMQKRNLIIA